MHREAKKGRIPYCLETTTPHTKDSNLQDFWNLTKGEKQLSCLWYQKWKE